MPRSIIEESVRICTYSTEAFRPFTELPRQPAGAVQLGKSTWVFVQEHLNVRPVLAVSLTAVVELLPDGLT